jgi:uncharacterized protein (TIRG00374 family)
LKKQLIAVARFLLFFGIGIFFIWLFLRGLTVNEKAEIRESFNYANYWWISIAILLGVLSHFVRAIRWKMLIEPLGHSPKNSNMFFAVMIGYLSNLALPRLGEVSRCTVLSRYEGVPFNKSFGTVITERAIDFSIFVLLFLINLFLQFGRITKDINEKIYKPLEAKFHLSIHLTGSLSILVLSFTALCLIFFLVFRKRIIRNKIYLKIKSLLVGVLEGMKSLINVKNLWLFSFYSLAIYFLYLLMAYLVFFSLPETAHLGIDAGLATLVFGTISFMVVQGGIGIYPTIVAATLEMYFVSKTHGYALGWLIWSSQTLTIIILGALSLLVLPVLNKKKSYVEA